MSGGSGRGTQSGVLARRIAGPVVLVLALVASVTLGAAGSGADATPAPQTTVPGSASSAPSGGSTASDPTTGTPTDTPASTDGTPSAGAPGVDTPGISMTVRPRPNGNLTVQQTVWLNTPTNTVQLAPPDLSAAGALFSSQSPKLVDLTLSTDSQDIPLDSTEVAKPRSVSLLTASSRFVVTYTLRDAVVRSRPSVAGRALGAIRPLNLAPDQPLPVVVDVLGRSVLAIVCPELGTDLGVDCAGPTNSGYRLSNPIPSTTSLLQLQLDLNRAS